MSRYEERKRSLLRSPTVSYWLKEAIERLDSRDAVDALRDAEFLAELQRKRWETLAGGSDERKYEQK